MTLHSFIIVLFLTSLSVSATVDKPFEGAFIAKQASNIIINVGETENRHAPMSTFKVALALMGFNEGILVDSNTPKWTFKKEYETKFPSWYRPELGVKYGWLGEHTPETFLKNSVLWFSHQITSRLGKKKFQDYVSKLNYGNQDVSGTPGRNDGLINSWLNTSLTISPREQVDFLEKLFSPQSALSDAARLKTRRIMDRQETWKGWKLYGKTGGGNGRHGWFIGWVEKGPQRIIFAQHVELKDPKIKTSAGLFAKEIARTTLRLE
jgi:beta-lactamase class D